MAEVMPMQIEHIVLQPQHASQHSQVLILHNGHTVRGLVPLTWALNRGRGPDHAHKACIAPAPARQPAQPGADSAQWQHGL